MVRKSHQSVSPFLDFEHVRRESQILLKKTGSKTADTEVYKVLIEGNECLLFTPSSPYFII